MSDVTQTVCSWIYLFIYTSAISCSTSLSSETFIWKKNYLQIILFQWNRPRLEVYCCACDRGVLYLYEVWGIFQLTFICCVQTMQVIISDMPTTFWFNQTNPQSLLLWWIWTSLVSSVFFLSLFGECLLCERTNPHKDRIVKRSTSLEFTSLGFTSLSCFDPAGVLRFIKIHII